MNGYSEVLNNFRFGPLVDKVCAETCIERYGEDLAMGLSIDGFKTDNDMEEGESIAEVILTRHGDILVFWTQPKAYGNAKVMASIEKAKSELRIIREEVLDLKPITEEVAV